MNMCLGSGSTNFVVPTYTAFNVVMVALVGGVVYKDFVGASPMQLGLFFGAIGICLAGLGIISLGQAGKAASGLEEDGAVLRLPEPSSHDAADTGLGRVAAGARGSVASVVGEHGRAAAMSERSRSHTRAESVSALTYQVWNEVRRTQLDPGRQSQASARPSSRSIAFSLCEAVALPSTKHTRASAAMSVVGGRSSMAGRSSLQYVQEQGAVTRPNGTPPRLGASASRGVDPPSASGSWHAGQGPGVLAADAL